MSDAHRTFYLVLAAAWFTIGVRWLATEAHEHGPARIAFSSFAFAVCVLIHFERFRKGR